MSSSNVPAVKELLKSSQSKDLQLNRDQAIAIVGYSFTAMAKMLKRLADATTEEYQAASVKDTAQASAYLAKLTDGVVRLFMFSVGRPDSRQGIVIEEMVRDLTPEQFETFYKWVNTSGDGTPSSH